MTRKEQLASRPEFFVDAGERPRIVYEAKVEPLREVRYPRTVQEARAPRKEMTQTEYLTSPDSPYRAEMAAASLLTAGLFGSLYWFLYLSVQAFQLTTFGYLWMLLMPFIGGVMAKAMNDVIEAIPLPRSVKLFLKLVTHTVALSALHFQLFDGRMLIFAFEALTGILPPAPVAAVAGILSYMAGGGLRRGMQMLLRKIFVG